MSAAVGNPKFLPTGLVLAQHPARRVASIIARKSDAIVSGPAVVNSHYRDGIVVEDGRNILRRELVCRVADEQARLTDGTVTDDDTPA